MSYWIDFSLAIFHTFDKFDSNRKDPKSLKIRVGEWDTQSAYEFFPHQDRLVVDAIIHEQYYPAALFNDVALLFLAEPIDLGPESDVVCLPRPDEVFDGSRCFATGWGKDQFGNFFTVYLLPELFITTA